MIREYTKAALGDATGSRQFTANSD